MRRIYYDKTRKSFCGYENKMYLKNYIKNCHNANFILVWFLDFFPVMFNNALKNKSCYHFIQKLSEKKVLIFDCVTEENNFM